MKEGTLKMTNKQSIQLNVKIIQSLEKAIEEQELFLTDNPLEAIYYHSEIGFISGEFDYGIRGNDHNILKGITGATWEQLLHHGTIIVPETNTYISDSEQELFNSFGIERIPLNDNQFVGHK